MATNVFDLYAKIGADTSGFDSAISGIKGAMSGLAGFVGDAAKKAAGAIASFGKSAIQTGMSFDASMAQVAATLGKSVDEVQDLRDFAKQMGESTRYSAMEAAQGLNYMALAGYDAEKSMKMLPEVMKLASAGGMELGHASDVITDAQSALGLSIEQTSTLINQMAKTASSSNTSVSQLGEAILQIGGTAKDMKGGTLELTTVLGVLANNGMKGAEGGTHLRNMLNSLTKPTKDARKFMEEYNISLFDAQGNMRSINDVFVDLNKAMGTMTQQDRKKVLTDIFNARDLKAAEALLASAGDQFDELMQKIKESEGAAGAMAQTQESTLTGAITMWKSAVEGVKINISEFFTPVLTKIVNSGTSAIQTISASIGKVGEAFKKDGFMGLFTAFKDEFSKIKSEAISAGGEVLKNLLQSLSGDAKKIGEGAVQFISNFANQIADSKVLATIGNAALDIIDGLAEGLTSEKALDAFIPAAGNLLTGLAKGIGAALTGEDGEGGLLGAVEKIIYKIGEWFTVKENRDEFEKASFKFLTALGKTVENVVTESKDILLAAAKAFLDVFLGDIDYDHGASRFWASFGAALKEKAAGIWDAFLGSMGVISPEQAMNEAYEHAGGSKQYQDFQREWEETAKQLGGYEEAYEHYMNMPYQSEDAYKSQAQKNYDQKNLNAARDAFNAAYKQIMDIPLYAGWVDEYVKNNPLIDAGDYEDAAEYIQKIINSRNSGTSDYYKSQGYAEKYGVKGIPVFGDGAIVSKPTLAMIGERGEPEAVVPLGHETETSRALGFGGGVVIQFGDIYVSGSQDAGNEVIRNIDEALREWQLRQKRGIGGVAWQP